MKTPPRYIQRNAESFMEAMQLIRERKYSKAILIVKETRNKKLTQRIQQKIDADFIKRTTKPTGCPTTRTLKYYSPRANN